MTQKLADNNNNGTVPAPQNVMADNPVNDAIASLEAAKSSSHTSFGEVDVRNAAKQVLREKGGSNDELAENSDEPTYPFKRKPDSFGI